MRFVRSNKEHTEWFVIWSHKGRESVVSRHATQEEAFKACWPKY